MKNEVKIISYSTDIFLQNGFYKITMDQLAKGLKISKKTIYKYFPSKSFLVKKVVKHFQIKTKKELDEIVNGNLNLIDKLEKIGEFFANFSLKVNKKVINDFFTHEPELWKNIDEFRKNVIESVWKKLIIQGQKEGVIISGEISLIVQMVLSSLTGVINPEFLEKNNFSTSEAFSQSFKIILNGILTEKGKKQLMK